MRYAIFFFLLSTGGNFFSFYNKKFEETLPLTVGFIIVFLYLFYICNHLNLGYTCLIVLAILINIFNFLRYIKSENKKTILANIFTPGFLIFLFCYCIIFLIVRNREVLFWDELRLWGAYPKILYYDGSIQLGTSAKLMDIMQSYEPGMPLFQFFFTKSINKFLERDLFFAYSIVGIVPLISVIKNLSFKKFYYIPIYVAIFLTVPLFLANSRFDGLSYYYTLFIEPILAIYFAYTLYLSAKENNSKIDYFIYASGLSILVLLKDTGIIFALTSLLSYLIINKNNKRKKWNIAFLFVICLSLFFSWKFAQYVYKTPNMYADNVTYKEVKTFLTSPSNNQKKILKDFKDVSLSSSYDSNFNFVKSYSNFYVVFILIILAFIYIVKKSPITERRKYKIVATSYITGSTIFMIGLLFLYLFSLSVVASFHRYSSVILSAGILFIIMFLVGEYSKKLKNYTALIIYLITFFVLVTPIKEPLTGEYLNEYARESKIYSNKIEKNVMNTKNIALVFSSLTKENGSAVIYHHHIYMNLIDNNFSFFPMINLEKSQSLNKYNFDKYSYVYFIVINEEDKKEFSKLLNKEIKNSTLFHIKKVSKKNGSIEVKYEKI